jgi:cytoplasmic iron level regulating protein YaaA (DUF328/UPF0246 family)
MGSIIIIPSKDEKKNKEETIQEEQPLYNINSENSEKIIKKLEEEGVQKLKEVHDIKELLQIMEDGTKEFKEKTGRNMTYAEMRAAYG